MMRRLSLQEFAVRLLSSKSGVPGHSDLPAQQRRYALARLAVAERVLGGDHVVPRICAAMRVLPTWVAILCPR